MARSLEPSDKVKFFWKNILKYLRKYFQNEIEGFVPLKVDMDAEISASFFNARELRKEKKYGYYVLFIYMLIILIFGARAQFQMYCKK